MPIFKFLILYFGSAKLSLLKLSILFDLHVPWEFLLGALTVEMLNLCVSKSPHSPSTCMEMHRRSSVRLRKALVGDFQASYKVLQSHTKYVLHETVAYASQLSLALKMENYVNLSDWFTHMRSQKSFSRPDGFIVDFYHAFVEELI